MQSIPDDPIISDIERTGFPPWMQGEAEEEEASFDDDDDEFYYWNIRLTI